MPQSGSEMRARPTLLLLYQVYTSLRLVNAFRVSLSALENHAISPLKPSRIFFGTSAIIVTLLGAQRSVIQCDTMSSHFGRYLHFAEIVGDMSVFYFQAARVWIRKRKFQKL